MECKLICSDIDGTLLDVNRSLSMETKTAVKSISPEIPFLLISSRMPKSMQLLQAELRTANMPLIAYNGALILDGSGNVLQSIEIPFAKAGFSEGLFLTKQSLSLAAFLFPSPL